MTATTSRPRGPRTLRPAHCDTCGRPGRTEAKGRPYRCRTCSPACNPLQEHEIALTGGTWTRHGLTWRWQPHQQEVTAA